MNRNFINFIKNQKALKKSNKKTMMKASHLISMIRQKILKYDIMNNLKNI